MIKKILFLFLLSLSSILAQQTEKNTVNGFIYDKVTGEALIGANAYIKKHKVGATTNLSGFFALPSVPNGKTTLTASYIGYKALNIDINVNSTLEVLKLYLVPENLVTKEVVVKGDSIRTIDKLYEKPISKIELNAGQINSIPKVIEADLLRSLQTLPGIQPLSDFSSALYIRGGTPDQNLYLLDGTDVYNPEHAFGIFSTFNTNAIKKVELSKGGFGAEFGGRLSSVLNVTNIDGNRNEFKGDVNISLLSASTTLQSPLWDFGSISGSFRRTYIDQTYAKIIDEIPDYYFYDGNVKAFLDISPKDKLVLSFYGGKDYLDYLFDEDDPNSLGFTYYWGNTTASINYKRIFSPKLFVSLWATGSRFVSNFVFEGVDAVERNKIEDISFKANAEYYLSNELNFKFGFEEKNLHGILYQEFEFGRADANKYRNHYIGYLTATWRPLDNLEVEAGGRYDYFNTEVDYKSFDPRFSAKYRVDETTNLKFSTGVYHQYLNRIPRLFLTSIWTSADEFTKGSSSVHYIFGAQKELWDFYEFEAEVYYKTYKNVYTFNQTYLVDITPQSYSQDGEPIFNNSKGLLDRGDGRSYGLELLFRKDFGSITGWLGYSLAKSETKIDGINKGKYFVPRHDRTHTVNAVINVAVTDLVDELTGNYEESSSKWLFNMNFVYSSGQPITLPGSVYSVNTVPDWTGSRNNVALYPSEINSVRLPHYMRLDLSITWEKYFDGWVLAPYIQVFNVGNRGNVWFITYENEIKDGVVTQKIENQNMMPILPSLGVNIKF